ncbi:MAG: ATP-binding cassette domain-containing protein [Odoribacteraceae bacterium]|nr:ATP-binding cassette domain-containing protein [Odoribacteraceae bacterium]
METIVKLVNATIGQQDADILHEVNMEIASGDFVYIIGRVGSGKSSLLRTLYADLPLVYGEGEVAGFSLAGLRKSRVPRLRRKCSIVFQDFHLLTDRSVRENLDFVLRATGWKRRAARGRVEEVLEQVGMPDAGDKFPHQLSGGEQQRVVLARALLNSPPVILADEPTGNIDPETSYRLIELLKEVAGKGTAVIIATHQYDLIERYPGRVFRCREGRVTEEPDFMKSNGAEA